MLLEHYFGQTDIFFLVPHNLLRRDFTVPAIETPLNCIPTELQSNFNGESCGVMIALALTLQKTLAPVAPQSQGKRSREQHVARAVAFGAGFQVYVTFRSKCNMFAVDCCAVSCSIVGGFWVHMLFSKSIQRTQCEAYPEHR